MSQTSLSIVKTESEQNDLSDCLKDKVRLKDITILQQVGAAQEKECKICLRKRDTDWLAMTKNNLLDLCPMRYRVSKLEITI